jgi:hypothetical protein
MIHKLVSTSSVLYDAATLQSSLLTIVPQQVQYKNQMQENFNSTQDNNNVSVSGVLFANYGTETQSRLNSIFFTLPEDEWDSFYSSQTFSHTDDYDNVMQCCLLYIKQNLMPMYGLTSNDWVYVTE